MVLPAPWQYFTAWPSTYTYYYKNLNSLLTTLVSVSVASSSSPFFTCSWFIHNGLVLNPAKTEAVYFGTSPRLQSLPHLTSIEVAGCFTGRLRQAILSVTFDKPLNFDQRISSALISSIDASIIIRAECNSCQQNCTISVLHLCDT